MEIWFLVSFYEDDTEVTIPIRIRKGLHLEIHKAFFEKHIEDMSLYTTVNISTQFANRDRVQYGSSESSCSKRSPKST